MAGGGDGRYAMTLAELEATAHVPLERQVEEQGEPPPEGPIPAQELDRLRLLGITGAGRLHPS